MIPPAARREEEGRVLSVLSMCRDDSHLLCCLLTLFCFWIVGLQQRHNRGHMAAGKLRLPFSLIKSHISPTTGISG